ncbi:translation initiation factor IF-2-like isoform X5 [Camelus ferus]|uniref:Translation initiation factor IF-2-like isoform X5 n=1 Tax=Camelus ferus TaxID=419612 RepID=A0A8B8U194_CAMFR|nr:translation initiation factor IF-2-like isoform X5 [Camelus ferus]
MWPLSREQPGQAGRPQHGAQGRAACPRGGLAPGPGPAPGVLLGLAAEWPDALVASSLPLGRPPPRWWVWGSGPPASATSAILPAPMSIFQKFPVGGAEPQRPPLAPPSPGSQCQMRAGDKSSIFLVLLGWQQGLPSATWLLAALPPGAGVAEAQAAPARTQGPAAGGGQRSGARGPVGRGLAPGDGLLASGTCPPLLAPVTSRARDPVFTALLLRSSPSSCARGLAPPSRPPCCPTDAWSLDDCASSRPCPGSGPGRLHQRAGRHCARGQEEALRWELLSEAGLPHGELSVRAPPVGAPHCPPPSPQPSHNPRAASPSGLLQETGQPASCPWPQSCCTTTPAECPGALTSGTSACPSYRPGSRKQGAMGSLSWGGM